MKKIVTFLFVFSLLIATGCVKKNNEVPINDSNTREFVTATSAASFLYPDTLEPVPIQLDAIEYVGFFERINETEIAGVSVFSFAEYAYTSTEEFISKTIDKEVYMVANQETITKNNLEWTIIEQKEKDETFEDPSPTIKNIIHQEADRQYVLVVTYFPTNDHSAQYNELSKQVEELFLATFSK